LTHANGLILIGASAGGTQAIEAVLSRLPAETPPVLIVQHMPAQFTRAFASRLDGLCAMTVVEATGGERLTRGVAYVAPGDSHLLVGPFGSQLRVLKRGQPVHCQRPAVDVLCSATRVKGVIVRSTDRRAPASTAWWRFGPGGHHRPE
jgi:two-component system chemotaxis response regulator CheB